jgi:hypothetical protein
MLYHALENGDFAPLEGLVNSVGYREDFNVLSTELMTRNDDRRMRYWGSISGIFLALADPERRHETRRKIIETMPRDHWSEEYRDLFTRVREEPDGEGFVDCWQVNGTGSVAISRGRFPREGEKNYSKICDEETNKVLHLSRIRNRYPPVTPWGAIIGTDDPNRFLRKRLIDLLAGMATYSITENIYAALGAIGAVEFVYYKLADQMKGKAAFRRLGVELDRSAIDSLIEETALVISLGP